MPGMTRRYAIIGSGALGGLYGGMLARSGFEVHFLLHRDFEHVAANGLRVDSVWGDFHLPRVNAHATTETMPACDVTIVALKTTANHLLERLLPPPTREGGLVLVLQNGLDVEADSAEVVGQDRVLGGCCFLCSNKVGPGHIKHLDYGQIVFGRYTAAVPEDAAATVCEELAAAGIDVKLTAELAVARWRKLMWNIPFNGLSVVLDASTDKLIEHPASLALCESIVAEVHTTAAACGVVIPEVMKRKTIDHTRTMVPYDSSMRLDYQHGRPMELEAIFGNPIRAAEAHGRAMPQVSMLYQQLQYLNAPADVARA